MRRGTREVDEIGAGLARRHDHQVHLRPAEQRDGGLRPAGAQDPVHRSQLREALDHGLGPVRLHEQVEVPDRLAAAAQGAGLDDAGHAGGALELRHEVVGQSLGLVEEQALGPRLQLGDPLEDPLLRSGADALQATQVAGLGGAAQVVERLDAQRVVNHADRPGADARDPQQLHEAGRNLRAEPVMEGHVAGRGELGDLVADRLPHPGDRAPVTGPVRRRDVERGTRDRVRGAMVGNGLEHDLALDLEDVADLVEDAGQVAVGEGHIPMVGRSYAATTRSWDQRGAGVISWM